MNAKHVCLYAIQLIRKGNARGCRERDAVAANDGVRAQRQKVSSHFDRQETDCPKSA
jgi:hypothetical protein